MPERSLPQEARPPHRLPRKRPDEPPRPAPFINLCGDYRFLRGGYWALVDAELNSLQSRPTPVQAITAQNCAASLLVARLAGIPCVDWQVARRPEDVEVPAVLVPNAGHTDTYYHVHAPRMVASQWRSATQNGTRAALWVRKTGKLRSMKTVVGVTTSDHYGLAWQVWTTFGIPLATVWYIEPDGVPEDGGARPGPLFLSLDPLPMHELTEQELRLFEEVTKRPMSPS